MSGAVERNALMRSIPPMSGLPLEAESRRPSQQPARPAVDCRDTRSLPGRAARRFVRSNVSYSPPSSVIDQLAQQDVLGHPSWSTSVPSSRATSAASPTTSSLVQRCAGSSCVAADAARRMTLLRRACCVSRSPDRRVTPDGDIGQVRREGGVEIHPPFVRQLQHHRSHVLHREPADAEPGTRPSSGRRRRWRNPRRCCWSRRRAPSGPLRRRAGGRPGRRARPRGRAPRARSRPRPMGRSSRSRAQGRRSWPGRSSAARPVRVGSCRRSASHRPSSIPSTSVASMRRHPHPSGWHTGTCGCVAGHELGPLGRGELTGHAGARVLAPGVRVDRADARAAHARPPRSSRWLCRTRASAAESHRRPRGRHRSPRSRRP